MRKLKRRFKKIVWKYWFWIAAGLCLTKHAVEYAYEFRGYVAMGGEWLVLPMLLAVVYFLQEGVWSLIDSLKDFNIPCLEEECDD